MQIVGFFEGVGWGWGVFFYCLAVPIAIGMRSCGRAVPIAIGMRSCGLAVVQSFGRAEVGY
ncbi:MAG TPA: hypothetical protein DER05_14365 [Lutibacter sp.]|nr:hypothetical protein [Lutibacter sp.]